MLARYGNAGGMNLSETRITEERAAFVSAISGGDIATAGVGRKKENVAVTAGCKNNGIAGERVDLASAEVARNNPLGMAVDQHKIEHFGLRKHFYRAESDLPAQCLVGAEQQLLTGLPARIKGPGN